MTAETTTLTWCRRCRKLTQLHLLVHTLEVHAPRIGSSDSRPYRERNWRTATLTAEQAR